VTYINRFPSCDTAGCVAFSPAISTEAFVFVLYAVKYPVDFPFTT